MAYFDGSGIWFTSGEGGANTKLSQCFPKINKTWRKIASMKLLGGGGGGWMSSKVYNIYWYVGEE